MKIIRGSDNSYVPASHEDAKNPGVYKKVLLKKGDVQLGILEMLNWGKLPVGKSFNPHFHEDMEEVFVIISGQVKAQIGEEEARLAAGDVLVVPVQTTHTFTNIDRIACEYIVFGISKNSGGKTITLANE